MSTFEERRAAALAAVREAQLEKALETREKREKVAGAIENTSRAPDARRILGKTLSQIERHVDEIAKIPAQQLTTQEASALDKYASAALKIVQAEAAVEKKRKERLDKMTPEELDALLAEKVGKR